MGGNIIKKRFRRFRKKTIKKFIKGWEGYKFHKEYFFGEGATPDFIVVGVERAGTTSLFRYLSKHVEIEPSFTKEVRYFYRSRSQPNTIKGNFEKDLKWYKSHFISRSKLTKYGKITGEATPSYLPE